MSEKKNGKKKHSISPVQKKACIVLACCALALLLTVVGVVVLLDILDGEPAEEYDPQAYPLDTTLSAVLPSQNSESGEYTIETLFAGDQYAAVLYEQGLVTINQFVGKAGLTTGNLMREACVYFAEDPNSYTIPQAVAKMKPRRVVLMLGANDLDGSLDVNAFVQNYRQAAKAINTAYEYCDIIVNAIPSVAKDAEQAAERQTRIDQFNQALAVMCQEEGFAFLNSSEMLKAPSGFAESGFLAEHSWNKVGCNTFLQYFKTHAWNTADRRPDASDVPQRASQPASRSDATPSPTPEPIKASYYAENGGTLTYNGQSGLTSAEIDVDRNSVVTVTAVAAEGFVFSKWSDGVTTESRTDTGFTQDSSVTAVFEDVRVSISLDKSDTAISAGDSVTYTAVVTRGGKKYSADSVQWSVNDEIMATAGSYTFTATAEGTYKLRAAIKVQDNLQDVTVTITVNPRPTSISISGIGSIHVGESTTLTATVQNGNGDTVWSCAQKQDWSAVGTQVQFTASSVGTYTIRATNNSMFAEFVLTVMEQPSASEPTPTPSAESTGDEHSNGT